MDIEVIIIMEEAGLVDIVVDLGEDIEEDMEDMGILILRMQWPFTSVRWIRYIIVL